MARGPWRVVDTPMLDLRGDATPKGPSVGATAVLPHHQAGAEAADESSPDSVVEWELSKDYV